MLEEAVRSGMDPVRIFVRDGCDKGKELALSTEAEVFCVSEAVYDKLTDEKAPQGVLTVCGFPKGILTACGTELQKAAEGVKGNILLLDSLQDCGNVGTILRTAGALDVTVMLCGDCADVFSPKTVRASMGALFFSNVLVCPDTVDAVTALRNAGRRVFAAALSDKGEVLGRLDILPTDCFVIGNEGNGVGAETIAACTGTVMIPMTHRVESLNAASAATVLMWEARRGS